VEADINDKLFLSTATRYEYYNDFGGNLSGKVAALWKVFRNVSLRSSINRGFRAPSLQQIYNGQTTTNAQNGLIRQTKQLSASDPRLAAIGIPQLRKIDAINDARQKNAETLNELLADVAEIATPVTSAGNFHVWHQYTIRVLKGSKRTRDEVIEYLTAQGVGCGIYYPYLAHDYDCFRGDPNIEPTATPIASRLVREVISLPVHQFLTQEQLERIAQVVRQAVQL
jgi:hypothetical protein